MPTKGSHPYSQRQGGESHHVTDLGLPQSVCLPSKLHQELQVPPAAPAVDISTQTTTGSPNCSESPCPPAAGQHNPGVQEQPRRARKVTGPLRSQAGDGICLWAGEAGARQHLPTAGSAAGRVEEAQGMRLNSERELTRHAYSLLVFYFIS